MFVGQTGIGRVVQRTCEVLRETDGDDPREHGAMPLELIQKYINFWVSSSNDLYGAEVSSNAATFFAEGLKGRAFEDRYEDHLALEGSYRVEKVVDGRIVVEEVPLRNAMNEVLRHEYIRDNQKGVDYWNRILEKAGLDFRFQLPHERFHRRIGTYAGQHFDVDGQPIDQATWNRRRDDWLPTEQDRAWIRSLMQPVYQPGKVAAWIAPPAKGINGQPLDFEYVRL